MSQKNCMSSITSLVSIDDKLCGTRARNNQVKHISNRKADREGHTADTICGAIFRITFGMRFRCCGESQSVNLEKLLDCFVEGLGKILLLGIIA